MHPSRRRKKRPNYGLRSVEVTRGSNGFGFTISGQQPCILSCIVNGSPADQAGLRAGDFLISVNGMSVSKITHDAVVNLIGNSVGPIKMTIAENYYSDSSDEEFDCNRTVSARKPKFPYKPRARAYRHEGRTAARGSLDSPLKKAIKLRDCPQRLCENENSLPMEDEGGPIEYKAIVGYLGTIEMPKELLPSSRLQTVCSCIRKLRQEKRIPTVVLMTILPTCLTLKNSSNNILAIYPTNRVVYISCSTDKDSRYFGLVTSAVCDNRNPEIPENSELEISNSCHVFITDSKISQHDLHAKKADAFKINCTVDVTTGNCLEFPENALYIIDLVQNMYKLQNGPDRRRIQNEDVLVANSPQPSASSNSDSGIGFRDDCGNVSDRILVVEFPARRTLPGIHGSNKTHLEGNNAEDESNGSLKLPEEHGSLDVKSRRPSGINGSGLTLETLGDKDSFTFRKSQRANDLCRLRLEYGNSSGYKGTLCPDHKERHPNFEYEALADSSRAGVSNLREHLSARWVGTSTSNQILNLNCVGNSNFNRIGDSDSVRTENLSSSRLENLDSEQNVILDKNLNLNGNINLDENVNRTENLSLDYRENLNLGLVGNVNLAHKDRDKNLDDVKKLNSNCARNMNVDHEGSLNLSGSDSLKFSHTESSDLTKRENLHRGGNSNYLPCKNSSQLENLTCLGLSEAIGANLNHTKQSYLEEAHRSNILKLSNDRSLNHGRNSNLRQRENLNLHLVGNTSTNLSPLSSSNSQRVKQLNLEDGNLINIEREDLRRVTERKEDRNLNSKEESNSNFKKFSKLNAECEYIGVAYESLENIRDCSAHKDNFKCKDLQGKSNCVCNEDGCNFGGMNCKSNEGCYYSDDRCNCDEDLTDFKKDVCNCDGNMSNLNKDICNCNKDMSNVHKKNMYTCGKDIFSCNLQKDPCKCSLTNLNKDYGKDNFHCNYDYKCNCSRSNWSSDRNDCNCNKTNCNRDKSSCKCGNGSCSFNKDSYNLSEDNLSCNDVCCSFGKRNCDCNEADCKCHENVFNCNKISYDCNKDNCAKVRCTTDDNCNCKDIFDCNNPRYDRDSLNYNLKSNNDVCPNFDLNYSHCASFQNFYCSADTRKGEDIERNTDKESAEDNEKIDANSSLELGEDSFEKAENTLEHEEGFNMEANIFQIKGHCKLNNCYKLEDSLKLKSDDVLLKTSNRTKKLFKIEGKIFKTNGSNEGHIKWNKMESAPMEVEQNNFKRNKFERNAESNITDGHKILETDRKKLRTHMERKKIDETERRKLTFTRTECDAVLKQRDLDTINQSASSPQSQKVSKIEKEKQRNFNIPLEPNVLENLNVLIDPNISATSNDSNTSVLMNLNEISSFNPNILINTNSSVNLNATSSQTTVLNDLNSRLSVRAMPLVKLHKNNIDRTDENFKTSDGGAYILPFSERAVDVPPDIFPEKRSCDAASVHTVNDENADGKSYTGNMSSVRGSKSFDLDAVFKTPSSKYFSNKRLAKRHLKLIASCDSLLTDDKYNGRKMKTKVCGKSKSNRSCEELNVLDNEKGDKCGYGSLQELHLWMGGIDGGKMIAQSEPDVRRNGNRRKDSVCDSACEESITEKSTSLGGPTVWSTSFEKLLEDPLGLHTFAEFLKKEFSAENIYFWTACERYRHLPPGPERKAEAQHIFDRHLRKGAPEPVNVDSQARQCSEQHLKDPEALAFDLAQKQIFNLMKFDSYPRFLKSDLYKRVVGSGGNVNGTHFDAGLSVRPTTSTATPSKLKKSLSNAEDRRRKSLLPWHRKNRSKSKDRGESEYDKSEIVVDIGNQTGKSFGSNSSKSSLTSMELGSAHQEVLDENPPTSKPQLCRVIVNMESTSVVQIREEETIQQLVNRVLEKRGIIFSAYEVFTKHQTKGINVNESALKLAGQEVVVEKRVLFKIDLPNRKTIAVKSKCGKVLIEVLRPILQKYQYNFENVTVSSRNFQSVDVRLPVTSVDGGRLLITVQGQNPTKTKDKDSNSLDEITNKVYEDILQEKSAAVSSKHKSDKSSVKSEDWGSEHSSGIFGRFLRRDSALNERKKKNTKTTNQAYGSIEDVTGDVQTKKPLKAKWKPGVKLQVARSESDELYEGLSRALKSRLEDQRGTEINFELPDFLKDNDNQSRSGNPRKLRRNAESTKFYTTEGVLHPKPERVTPSIAATKNLKSDYENRTIFTKDPPSFVSSNLSNGNDSFDNQSRPAKINNLKSYSPGKVSGGGLEGCPNKTEEVSARNGEPPPLPPKPKVLPTRPSNWGQNLKEKSELYLEKATSSFV